jgi:MYXO-CTERM domain-containing protein
MVKLPRLALFLGAGLLVSSSAAAYTPKTAAGGAPVHWRESALTVVADPSLSALGPGAVKTVTQAFAAWNAVSGAYAPVVTVVEGTADEIGYHDGANRCTVRYLPQGYALAGKALAITLSSMDGGGQLLDADIVINGGEDRPFALPSEDDDEGEGGNQGQHGKGHGSYDLQSVLTHEVGHFFGLDENRDDPAVTMYFETGRDEVEKRDLAPDDEAGLRYLYPTAGGSGPVCSTGAPGSAPRGGGAALVLIGALLLRMRRGQRG